MRLNQSPAVQTSHQSAYAALPQQHAVSEVRHDYLPIGVPPHGRALGRATTAAPGVGGLATVGDIGYLVRKHGSTIDHLRTVEMVLADGSIVRGPATKGTPSYSGQCAAPVPTSASRSPSGSQPTRSTRLAEPPLPARSATTLRHSAMRSVGSRPPGPYGVSRHEPRRRTSDGDDRLQRSGRGRRTVVAFSRVSRRWCAGSWSRSMPR